VHGFTLRAPILFREGVKGELCPRLGKHGGGGLISMDRHKGGE